MKTDETPGDELSYLAESMIAQLEGQLGGNYCGKGRGTHEHPGVVGALYADVKKVPRDSAPVVTSATPQRRRR